MPNDLTQTREISECQPHIGGSLAWHTVAFIQEYRPVYWCTYQGKYVFEAGRN